MTKIAYVSSVKSAVYTVTESLITYATYAYVIFLFYIDMTFKVVTHLRTGPSYLGSKSRSGLCMERKCTQYT